MAQKQVRGKPWVTIALIGTGAILASTGVTMLAVDLAKTKILYGAWKMIGISHNGVAVLHQYSAIGFLAAAGVHLTRNRKIIGRHLQQVVPTKSADPQPVAAQTT